MGTDIHLAVEAKIDNVWTLIACEHTAINLHNLLPLFPNGTKEENSEYWANDPAGRNYNVFAFLAGVRNGSGFAGVYRHKPVAPLFEGRGFPLDRSPLPLDEYGDQAYLGEHSETWASYQELAAAPWGLVFKSAGIVPVNAVPFPYQDGWKPESWCGGISGPGIVVWNSYKEWEAAGFPGKGETTDWHHVRLVWEWAPLIDSGFHRWVRGPLAKAAEHYGPQNLRVLMGFDS